MGLRVIWPGGDGREKPLRRFVEHALALNHNSQIEVGFGQTGVASQGILEASGGPLEFTPSLEYAS